MIAALIVLGVLVVGAVVAAGFLAVVIREASADSASARNRPSSSSTAKSRPLPTKRSYAGSGWIGSFAGEVDGKSRYALTLDGDDPINGGLVITWHTGGVCRYEVREGARFNATSASLHLLSLQDNGCRDTNLDAMVGTASVTLVSRQGTYVLTRL